MNHIKCRSYHVVSHRIVSYLTVFHLIVSCLTVSCLIVSYLSSCRIILSYHVVSLLFSYRIMSYLIVFHLIVSYPTVYLILSHRTWPSLAIFYNMFTILFCRCQCRKAPRIQLVHVGPRWANPHWTRYSWRPVSKVISLSRLASKT